MKNRRLSLKPGKDVCKLPSHDFQTPPTLLPPQSPQAPFFYIFGKMPTLLLSGTENDQDSTSRLNTR